MLQSPFNPGAGTAPPVLAGRENLLADAEERLTRADHFGRASSPLVWTGVRGVGKTVTLLEVRRRAELRGFVVAHVTADPSGGLAPRLAESVAGALAAAEVHRRGAAWVRLAERLSAFNVQISVAGVVSLGASASPAADATTSRDMLRALVVDAATQLTEAGKAGLVLNLDELQAAPIGDLRALVYAAQEWTVAGAAVVTLGAGLPALPERLMEAGSFAERFSYRRLENLTPQASLQALVAPAEQARVRWAEKAAEAIVAISGGSPYLLQLYGDAAWLVAQPNPGTTIGPREVEAGVKIAERTLWDGQYRGRWNRATPAERDLLAAIASTLDGRGVALAADVASRLGKTSKQLSRDRASLIDKGFIEPVGHGQLGFTVPGFERFVRSITAPDQPAEAAKGRHHAPSITRRGGPALGR